MALWRSGITAAGLTTAWPSTACALPILLVAWYAHLQLKFVGLLLTRCQGGDDYVYLNPKTGAPTV